MRPNLDPDWGMAQVGPETKDRTTEYRVRIKELERAIESVLYARLGGHITSCSIGGVDSGTPALDELSRILHAKIPY